MTTRSDGKVAFRDFEAMLCECGATRAEHRRGPAEGHTFEPVDWWARRAVPAPTGQLP